MILGDSLNVMASLAEREGLRGKVQCIYIDPPYGIRFNSNFQWSTTSRDVKDGKSRARHPRAGAGQGVPRHVAGRHPLVPELLARPPDRGAGLALRVRLDIRADRRRECPSCSCADGRGVWRGETNCHDLANPLTERLLHLDSTMAYQMSTTTFIWYAKSAGTTEVREGCLALN